MKASLIFALLFSLNCLSSSQFKNCSSEIVKNHKEANQIIKSALDRLTSRSDIKDIEYAFGKYFKLSLLKAKDTSLIKKVISNIKRIAKSSSKTNYTCHKADFSIWCSTSPLAIVPPPKSRVHLCNGYFTKINKRQQVGTIIHEWFHLWGGSNINYLPETYCSDSANLKSSSLIRNSDQYMLFIYHLGKKGKYLGCF